MKVIFLDIDGVLNDFGKESLEASFHNRYKSNNEIEGWAKEIDAPKVVLLNKLIEKTGAKVVISSSWRKAGARYGRSPKEMQQILEIKGFKGEVIGETPRLFQCRADEICHWAEEHKNEIESIVILDDSDIHQGQNDNDMTKWFVKTNCMLGVTENELEQATNILTNTYP